MNRIPDPFPYPINPVHPCSPILCLLRRHSVISNSVFRPDFVISELVARFYAQMSIPSVAAPVIEASYFSRI